MRVNVNERNVALTALKYINDGFFVDNAIKKVFEQNINLEKRQKSFIKRIVYGVVENRILIDYYIDYFSNTKTKKMSAIVRLIMELSVYQILFMDSVPNRAVINEGVKLAKKRKIHRLSGFVNAVLRKVAISKDEVKMPTDKIQKISIENSMPIDLVKYLQKQLSKGDFEQFVSTLNDTTLVTIRANDAKIKASELKSKLEQSGVKVSSGDIFDYCFKIDGYENISELYGFKDGYFQVQDESSTIVGHIIRSLGVKKVLDMCAAPAGKTTHIAQDSSIQVVSCDVSSKKTSLIKENIDRLGQKNVQVLVNDGTVFNDEFENAFDLVLADVPCSGLGVIRKKPDIKYSVSEKSVADLVNLQRNIIKNAIKYVKNGGYLVYSTCTITKEENEENVKFITDNFKDFKLVNIDFDKVSRDSDYIRLIPKANSYDGFFIALFKKD